MQYHPEIKYAFKAGEKFVYLSGERFGQRGAHEFFENCKNVPPHVLKNLEIYFVECFPAVDIYDNDANTAIHEEFA